MKQEIEMLDALFKNATEGIIVVGKDAGIVLMNPKAEILFGYTKEELIGRKIECLIPQRFGSHREHRDEYMKHPHARAMGIGFDLYAMRKDGSEFPVEVSLSSFNTSEGQFFMSFIIDITERKKQESEIIALNAQLEKRVEERTEELAQAINRLAESKQEVIRALETEKELNELKSRFITTASHEFRTPLGTILSSASLIAKYDETEQQDKRIKHIARISSAVHNLTHILNDFLSLSKLEEGVIRNQPEELHLIDFIADIVDEMNATLKERQQITFHHNGLESKAALDKQLLKNVLINLLSNAIKYSPPDKPILLSTFCSKEKVIITVKDEGIGIPTDDQPLLFERFFRARNASAFQGTGLGLNIVKKYIELMSGAINFSSEENKGTTFIIELPLG